MLLELIYAAQAASPSIAAAASRIEQARASSVAAGALLIPALNANGSATTGRTDVGAPVASFASVNLQASWELDLFGANQAGSDAAVARLQGAEAGWHDARIAVAAEVAATYNSLRSCEAVVLQTEADTRSRAETARVTELAAKAGLFAPATAALARASAAQGRSLLAGQQAQCELLLKALVALTALDERALRNQLAPRHAQLPQPAQLEVQSVPAEALRQRPDLVAAERLVVGRGRGHQPKPGPALSAREHLRFGRSGLAAHREFLGQRQPVDHRPLAGVDAAVRRRHAGGQCGGCAGPLRRGGVGLPRPGAPGGARGRSRVGHPGHQHPARAGHEGRGRGFRSLAESRRCALPRRAGQPVRPGGGAAQRAGRQQHADRVAARAGRRLDQPVPRPRRWLEPRPGRHQHHATPR